MGWGSHDFVEIAGTRYRDPPPLLDDAEISRPPYTDGPKFRDPPLRSSRSTPKQVHMYKYTLYS